MQNKNFSLLLSIMLSLLMMTITAAEEERAGQSLHAVANFATDKMTNMDEITQEYFTLALNGYTPVQMQEFYDLRTQLWEDLPNDQWHKIFLQLTTICDAANRLDVAKLTVRFMTTIRDLTISPKSYHYRSCLIDYFKDLPIVERSGRVNRVLEETAHLGRERILELIPWLLDVPLNTALRDSRIMPSLLYELLNKN